MKYFESLIDSFRCNYYNAFCETDRYLAFGDKFNCVVSVRLVELKCLKVPPFDSLAGNFTFLVSNKVLPLRTLQVKELILLCDVSATRKSLLEGLLLQLPNNC